MMAATTVQEGGAVRDYHQGLAQHLLDLIRKRKPSSFAPPTTPLDTRSSSTTTIPPPANPRQLSDSSLESNSKISSGQTTESKPSSGELQTTDSNVEGVDKSASSPDETGIDGDEKRSDGDGRLSESGSGSDANDQTARPDLNRSHFLTIPPTNKIAAASTTASSAVGDQTCPPSSDHNIQSSQSSSNQSGHHDRRQHTTRHTHTVEPLTREDEHRKAWEADGKRVWRNIAPSFELRLEKKPRAKSNASSAVSPPRSIQSGLSGAGPGTAIRADPVFIPDSEAESKVSERLSTSLQADRETMSEVSRPEQFTAPSQSSVSMSVAKITQKQRSTLQKRQAGLEAESEPELRETPRKGVDHTPTRAMVRGRSHMEAKDVRISPSDEERNEYHLKREARLRKKEHTLAKRIGIWRTEIDQSGLYDSLDFTPPEIEPHLPSPTTEASRLRFPPLPPNMPDRLSAHSPNLQLPPLHLIEDNRKLRTLRLIPEQQNGESDVDLLIRLTELNRISSATSNSFRGAYPPGASPYGAQPLGIRPGLGSGLISGAVEVHSFRVKDSMPTPKVSSHRATFGGLDIPPI